MSWVGGKHCWKGNLVRLVPISVNKRISSFDVGETGSLEALWRTDLPPGSGQGAGRLWLITLQSAMELIYN